MKKTGYKIISLLLSFSMIASLLITTSFAAEKSLKIILDYPEDVPAEDVVVTMFDGVPQWRQKNSATDVEDVIRVFTEPTNPNFPKLNVIEPNEDGSYTVTDAHGYCYLVRGKEAGQYYNIIKLFVVSEDDLAAGEKHILVKTGPSAGSGFESGNNNPVGENGETVPEGFNQGVQHMVPIEGTDEMEPLMGTDGLKDYVPFTTPAFTEGRAMYQATTQQEMMDFIAEYAADCPYMHVYSMGTTSNYNYDYPLLVFTKKDIPANASMDDAAEILKDGGLPIIWQQAQIHPYEPAAGESALVMIQELCGDYGENILDSVDVVMVPRVNVEGAFLFWRGDYTGTDMNRDHMAIATEQIAMLHDAYYKFNPHVVIDNHEFFFSEMGNYNNNPEEFKLNDFQITGATSLNDDPEITDITTNLVVDKMHADLFEYGFRPYHYGITSNNPIGRAYYGLDNAISILIESHGADGALFAFPRRVYGQVIATKSIYETTSANAERIVTAVNDARAAVVEKGATYEEDDILVLKQSASGAVTSPTPLPENVADIYGNIRTTEEKPINLQDTVVRSRPRPTAYIVDAGVEWLDDLTYILDHHNAEYFMLDAGTTLPLQQYYYIEKDGAKSCIADLREEADVTFENGCLMIPMDQEVGTIIGMLMEPDVGDSSSYNGTLFQYGLLTYDDEMNFPLYRYIVDNPRDLIPEQEEAALTFEFPESYGKNITAKVDLYKGIPTSSSTALETMVKNGTLTLVAEDVGFTGCAMPEEPGVYCYRVYGEGNGDYYTVLKLFNITQEDIDAGEKNVVLEGGKCAGEGYEPGYKPPLAPDTYKKDNRDSDLMNWPDEVLEHFKVEPQGYQTPAFDGEHAQNEFTSQEELMEFVQDRTANCDFMYLYSAGTTPNYGFDLPMVLVTTTPIPEGATLEEAAAAMTADGKVNVWYQSQIHPNEPAAGEGSLVMIDNFVNDDEYKALLDKVNVIVVPRINPDGSYLFTRATYDGFDMNRDHTSLKAAELAQLHTAWRLFMTEVVIDTHEFTYYGYNANLGQMSNADDIQTTPATSLNNDPNVTALALRMTAAAFEEEKNADVGEGYDPIRVNHYGGTGWTANPPIGRCYFGLFDCLSFLVETRGIGAGKNNFERRVFSQENAVTGYLKFAAENADEIKETVAQARADLVEQGKTFDENSMYALYQTASGEKVTPYVINSYTYKLDGTEVVLNENRALPLNDTAEHSRVRPTAYVIPADHENIDRILYIFDNQGAEYGKLDPGTTVELQQYYYKGDYIAANGRARGFEADLRDSTEVTFENGAYLVPMDQVAANVIAAICEPDVIDSNGYDGSLVQFGQITYDEETKNYPIYRYTGDNPRDITSKSAENAILYQVNDNNELEYNVVYSGELSEDLVITDKSGNDINSIEALREIMGVADKPAVVHGTDKGERTLGKAVRANLELNAIGDVVSIEIVSVTDRPTIGISWKSDRIGTDYQGFAEAYERNGAYAVFLPQVTTVEEAQQVLGEVNGIFMTGGEDWNPKLYNQTQSPHGSSGYNDARDTSDILLMQNAIALDVPMLAVCRGEQGFNVAMGGALVQDIPYYLGQKVISGEIAANRVSGIVSGKIPETVEGYADLPDELKIEVPDTGYTYYDEDGNRVGQTYDRKTGEYAEYGKGCEEGHLRVQIDGLIHSGGTGYHVLAGGIGNDSIAIDKNSKWLYEIFGSETLEFVATAHHQAADPEQLGNGLTVVARSSDGIVEAIEYQNATFALGLQWHPERDALRDTRGTDVDQDLSNAPLQALVKYAGVNMNKSDEPVPDDPVTPTPKPETKWFEDVKDGDWFYDDVKYVFDKGLMKGTSDTTFSPADPTSRGMIVTILYRLEGEPAVAAECPFSDVEAGKYYEKAVIWAAENKIVNGYGDGKFGPDDNVTREQLAAILFRFAQFKGYDVSVGEDTNILSYNDAFSISEWAMPAMQWACGAGLLQGDGAGNLMPANNAARCEAAAILHRFCENVAQ